MKEYNVWQMLGVQYWGVREVKNILLNSGYGVDDVVDAKYEGVGNHNAVFSVTYDGRHGEAGKGRVYVKSDDKGFLRAEF